ncbi:MAG: FHA domain-containing protein [Candidatus Eisenbacteria bacterium]
MTRVRISGSGEPREVEIEGPALKLGRSPNCDIELHGAGVSREHAELRLDVHGWSVRDLGSSNGTFVNDQRIEHVRLEHGDVIRLGPVSALELLLDAPAAAPPDDDEREVEYVPDEPEPEAVARDDDEDDDDEPAPARAAKPAKAARGKAGAPRSGGAWWQERRWTLTSTDEDDRYELELVGARVTVGREDGNGLVIDDGSISRVHARFDADGDSLTLTDLKSANGTWVNDERVLSRPVSAGDRVRFGDLEYTLGTRFVFAASRFRGPVGIGAALVLVALLAWFGATRVIEWESARRVTKQFRAQAAESVQQGVSAAKAGDADLARGHFKRAADLLILSGLAPEGADPNKPAVLFREVASELSREERDFDFESVYDAETLRRNEESLSAMSPREYVEHELRRYCAELGQDPNLPPEFVEQVWHFIEEYQAYPAGMRQMLRRSKAIEPRMVGILAKHRLPAMVSYVAWVESELDPMKKSPAGAVGLWQLMSDTARERGLRVNEADLAHDDRTDVVRSTNAAADYLSTMLKDQGPEYFMLVLASYNRGHNALKAAKQKVDEPMLSATRKYWFLVERKLLPEETRNYVPKILAVRLIAESPERFGFQD